jgi:putative glutamine amidotransferase
MKVGVTFHDPKRVGPYSRALEAAGLEPVELSPGGTSPASVEGLDGLLISGGPDIDPSWYGEAPDGAEEPVRDRDEMEFSLLETALERDMPVLCICRGMQLLNVHQKGSLHQDLASKDLHRQKKNENAHTVDVAEGTHLAEAVGKGARYEVNSRHHQAVKKLGDGLKVSAYAPDGLVEAIELPDKYWVVGVQWHPEDRINTSEQDRNLFAAFARALAVR